MSSEMVDMGRKPKADSELTANARRVRRHEQKKVAELETLRARVSELEAREREEAELNELKRELDEHDAATPEAEFSIARWFSEDDARDLEDFRRSRGRAYSKISDERLVVEFVREQLELERRRAAATVKAIYRA